MSKFPIILFLLLVLLLVGCGKPQIDRLRHDSVILAFGDSLTSGFGVSADESYPAVLEKKIGCTVINGGVSGEDTSAGLKRLANVLSEHAPDLVIVCFGGNDMLRKQSRAHTVSNLRKMIDLIRRSEAEVVLLGVPRPGLILSVPGFYEDLSKEYELPYEGDILKRVLSNRSLKSDHIHPNRKGYELLAERVFEIIKKSEK